MEEQNNNLTSEQTELLRRNLEISEKVLEETAYIKKYIKWQQVWATVRLLILIVPIILGFLYLPDFIKGYLNSLSF